MKDSASGSPIQLGWDSEISPSGFSIEMWCRAVGISRTSEFCLRQEEKPHSVQVGRRRIIIEHPRDWLQRMRSLQEAA